MKSWNRHKKLYGIKPYTFGETINTFGFFIILTILFCWGSTKGVYGSSCSLVPGTDPSKHQCLPQNEQVHSSSGGIGGRGYFSSRQWYFDYTKNNCTYLYQAIVIPPVQYPGSATIIRLNGEKIICT